MIWADRAGLAAAALIALCAGLLTAVLFVGVGNLADFRLAASMVQWAGVAEGTIALPFWLLLRLADLVFGGPGHRKRMRAAGVERKPPDLRDISLIPLDETAGD